MKMSESTLSKWPEPKCPVCGKALKEPGVHYKKDGVDLIYVCYQDKQRIVIGPLEYAEWKRNRR